MASDPYVRPTLTALRKQAMQDITASDLPGADGLLQKSVLRVMAWVMAGFAWLHYDFLDWIYKQSNPWSATGAASLAWGALVKVSPKPAVAAGSSTAGTAVFPAAPGPSGSPTTLAAGATVYRLDGYAYTTTAAAVVASGVVTAPLLAAGGGAIGNAAAGTQLRLGTTTSGVTSSGTIGTALADGADAETLDAFKSRYLAEYAAPPQGGDAADYVAWALAVPGASRAWVAPNGAGVGTVVVWTMFDDETGTAGFPSGANGVAGGELRDAAATGDQLTVANAIFPVQPVTALVYSCAPTPQPVNFLLANVSPNTPAIQTAVRAALADMFLRVGRVGGSIDPTQMVRWGTIYASDWNEAIDAVPGLIHCTVVAPVGPLVPSPGCLFVLGTSGFTS